MEITKSIKQELYKIFRQHGVLLAYIFGSAVSGYSTAKSDLDMAVLLPDAFHKTKRFQIRLKLMEKLARLLKKDIDLVILNDTLSLFFRYNIITDGKILYQKNEGLREDFESRLLGIYFDFQPFLDLYNKHYVKSNL